MKTRIIHLWSLLALSLIAGCPSSNGPPEMGVLAPCQSPNVVCDHQCVDLTNNLHHCGDCATDCARLMPDAAVTEWVCRLGTCGPACIEPLTACGPACVDRSSNAANCGACGTRCPNGQVCSVGACQLRCPPDATNCSGGCVALSTDNAHCGACDHACQIGEVCAGGQCQLRCQQGMEICSGTCVNLQSDNANCGACKTACAPGNVCALGQCGLQCQKALTNCGGRCVDTLISNDHCGDCATSCPLGIPCLRGACKSHCSETLALASPPLLSVGHAPAAVAAGDFDGDGRPDLAVVNRDDNGVGIYLNQADGSFAASVSYVTGLNPTALVVSDLNGDKAPDLVVVNNGSMLDPGGVVVLMGHGDGSFAAPFSHRFVVNPVAAAVGDWNNDAIPDLFMTGKSGSFLLIGKGDGTFPGGMAVAASGQAIVAADYDEDGKLDIAVAGGTALAVYLGDGTGRFPTMKMVGMVANPQSLTAADLNKDRHVDLALANGTANNALLWMGNGDGSFQTPVALATGSNASSLAIRDWTGDGKLDVAVANYGDDDVSVLAQQVNGSFILAAKYLTGRQPLGMWGGDLNGDGASDLAIANLGDGGKAPSVSVLIAFKGALTGSVSYPLPQGGQPTGVAIGDLNLDGRPELVVAHGKAGAGIFLNSGDGTYKTVVNLVVGSNPSAVAIGDLNGDGKNDLVTADQGDDKVSVLLWAGLLPNQAPAYRPAVHYPAGKGPASVAIGDLNGDGKVDLVVADKTASGVTVLWNDGSGAFGSADFLAAGQGTTWVAVADVNGDGKLDIVTANLAAQVQSDDGGAADDAGVAALGGVSVLVNQGPSMVDGGTADGGMAGGANPSFAAHVDYDVGGSPYSVVTGDFNGDGKVDLATANFYDSTVTVLRGDGAGAFTAAKGSPVACGPQPTSVTARDLDGDGKLDLVTANQGDNTVSLLHGNGDGSFAAALVYATGPGPAGVAIGDLNGDGKPDIATSNGSTTGASVLLNNGRVCGFR